MRSPERLLRTVLIGCTIVGLSGCGAQGSASGSPTRPAPMAGSSTPAPTATLTEGPAATVEPAAHSPTAAPSSPPAPDAQQTAWLPYGRWAMVTADNLRVRYVPGVDDAIDSVVATVDAGASVLVIGPGAISAGGFEWYEVAYGAGVGPDGYVHAVGIGFVAGATSQGEQFIALSDESCPIAPVDVVTLAGLTGWALAHCDIGQLVGLEGMLNQPIHGPLSPFVYEPGWLRFSGWFLTEPDEAGSAFMWTGWSIELHFPPDTDASALRRGDLVRVDGHLNDPAASECRIVRSGEEGAPEPSEDQQQAFRLRCSVAFVVDALEVTGHFGLAEH